MSFCQAGWTPRSPLDIFKVFVRLLIDIVLDHVDVNIAFVNAMLYNFFFDAITPSVYV